MPRYFIDTSDEEIFCRDEEGWEFDDFEAAKDAAVAVLPDMARDKLPGNDARTFMAIVRDENARALVQVSLSLQMTVLVAGPTLKAPH